MAPPPLAHNPRILVISALGRVIEPALVQRFPSGQIVVVTDPAQVRETVTTRPRFDVVVVDLLWNDRRFEWRFDGLDAIEVLRETDRATAVICALQGRRDEDDHVAEVLDSEAHPEVVGVVEKTDGPAHIIPLIEAATLGRTPELAKVRPTLPQPALHAYFRRGRGRTAGILAATVATGRVANHDDLARIAKVAPDTANKLTGYLAPLLWDRGDVPREVPVTQPTIHRWCGEHAHYLLSWARRHLPADADLTRWDPAR